MGISKATKVRVLVGFISGILFGMGMIISGMSDPKVVIAFLDMTGEWDPSLAFVMGGGLGVFVPFYHFLIKPRKQAINGDEFKVPANQQIDRTLISGAAIFGVGWGLSGICPGPAVASIGGGSNTIFAFILCMLAGMVFANQYLAGRLPLPFVGYRQGVCSTGEGLEEVSHGQRPQS